MEDRVVNQIVSALSEDEIVYSNLLATVTRNCVIIPNPDGHAQTVVALSRISSVRNVKSSYPGFLVISGALGLIAAAAACSKDGHGAAWPVALLAFGFAIAYIGTRRGSVSLSMGNGHREIIETMSGSLRDAAAIVAAIQEARNCAENEAAA